MVRCDRLTMVRAELGSRMVDVTWERWWWRRVRPPAGFTVFLLDPVDEYGIDD
jgi:hypothetical protein